MKMPRRDKKKDQVFRDWLERGEKHNKVVNREGLSVKSTIVSAQSPSDQNLINRLYDREKSRCDLIKMYAESVRQFDQYENYQNKTLRELLGLPEAEKKLVIGMLEGKLDKSLKKLDISRLTVLALLSKADKGVVHLMPPVYAADIGAKTRDTLASCLNDAISGILMTSGYECSDRETYMDLVKYTLKGPPFDDKKVSRDLTEEVRKKYPSVGNISMFVDDCALFPSLR